MAAATTATASSVPVAEPVWCALLHVAYRPGGASPADPVPGVGLGGGLGVGLGGGPESGVGVFVPELRSAVSPGVRRLRVELASVVLDVVAARHAVPIEGVRSSSRLAELVACRADAAWAMRRGLGVGTAEIAVLLRPPARRGRTRGAARHSSVCEMVRRVERSGDRAAFDARAVSVLLDAGDRWGRDRAGDGGAAAGGAR